MAEAKPTADINALDQRWIRDIVLCTESNTQVHKFFEGLPYTSKEDVKKKNDLLKKTLTARQKRLSAHVDRIFEKYDFNFSVPAAPHAAPRGGIEDRNRQTRTPTSRRSSRSRSRGRGEDADDLPTVHDSPMMRVVLKPINTKLDVVETYVTKCKLSTPSTRSHLPETSEVVKMWNDKMTVSQTFVCISKTQEDQEKIRSPQWCRFLKKFLVVTEEKDIGETKDITAQVTDSGKKQTLEIEAVKTLYHDQVPGKKFTVFQVIGSARSPLFNESYLYKTFVENGFIFTESLTNFPVMICIGMEIIMREPSGRKGTIAINLPRGHQLDEAFKKVGFSDDDGL